MRKVTVSQLLAAGLEIELGPAPLFDPNCNETVFQDYVLDRAAEHGWLRAHFRPAETKRGWRTPVSADGKGFPDLVLLRERLIVAELKAKYKKPSREQRQWLDAFRKAGVETYLWYPRDINEIITILGR